MAVREPQESRSKEQTSEGSQPVETVLEWQVTAAATDGQRRHRQHEELVELLDEKQGESRQLGHSTEERNEHVDASREEIQTERTQLAADAEVV